jgi:hypothetical protein
MDWGVMIIPPGSSSGSIFPLDSSEPDERAPLDASPAAAGDLADTDSWLPVFCKTVLLPMSFTVH